MKELNGMINKEFPESVRVKIAEFLVGVETLGLDQNLTPFDDLTNAQITQLFELSRISQTNG
jgi:hypothetical protein